MRIPCPSCPDGNEWSREGPTGRACQTCKGKAYIERDARQDDFEFDEPESPYCECGNDPTEDEEASNQCAACGKPIEI